MIPDGILGWISSELAPPKGVRMTRKDKDRHPFTLYMKVACRFFYPGRPIAEGVYISLTKGKSLGSVSSEYTAELDALPIK